MHYTSVENIHKVTGPLFYDDLKNELTTIEGIKSHKERQFKLRKFREKLASIYVLDPACGSGNFLTETYLSFRKLENRILEDLQYDQVEGQMTLGQMEPIMVSLDQFYGIEIDDFAVSVAKTALWIAQLQMTMETSEVMGEWIAPLPLKTNDNIVCGNALRMDWNDVLPAEKCDYIIGNPPFIGKSFQTPEQKDDIKLVFSKVKGSGNLDYVASWFKKAADYSYGTAIKCSLVATNSVCQGIAVPPLWNTLFEKGIIINFAYRTFIWNNEALEKAHVHCVIIGFSYSDYCEKRLYFNDGYKIAKSINAYLLDAPNIIVESRISPFDEGLPHMYVGSCPTDGGAFVLLEEEKKELLALAPEAIAVIRPYVGSVELIRNQKRYCLWLKDCNPSLLSNPIIAERVSEVIKFRSSSKKQATREKAKTPTLFAEDRYIDSESLCIPMASSQNRDYVPMAFLPQGTVISNLASFIADPGLYVFGVITSSYSMAWMRTVGSRLKSDYRFSASLVYNTFPWPKPTAEQKSAIEHFARVVLDARNNHPGWSLAQLYDPDEMPDDLREAHKALDAAVEAAYGVDFQGDEEKIVEHLFKLYEQAIQAENSKSPKKESKPAAVKVKIKKKAR